MSCGGRRGAHSSGFLFAKLCAKPIGHQYRLSNSPNFETAVSSKKIQMLNLFFKIFSNSFSLLYYAFFNKNDLLKGGGDRLYRLPLDMPMRQPLLHNCNHSYCKIVSKTVAYQHNNQLPGSRPHVTSAKRNVSNRWISSFKGYVKNYCKTATSCDKRESASVLLDNVQASIRYLTF